jgi:hypothetical protein
MSGPTCVVCDKVGKYRSKVNPDVTFCSGDHHNKWKRVGVSFFKKKKKTFAASHKLETVLVNHMHNIHKLMVGLVWNKGIRQRDYKEAATVRLSKDPKLISGVITSILNEFDNDTSYVGQLEVTWDLKDSKLITLFEAILQDRKRDVKARKDAAEKKARLDAEREAAVDKTLFDIFDSDSQIGLAIVPVVLSAETQELQRLTVEWAENVFSESIAKISHGGDFTTEAWKEIGKVSKALLVHTMREFKSLVDGNAAASFGHEDDTVRLIKSLSELIFNELVK